MLRTVFHHPDLAVPLDDLGLYLANLLMQQLRPVGFTAGNGLAGFLDTGGAQRIGLPRPPEN